MLWTNQQLQEIVFTKYATFGVKGILPPYILLVILYLICIILYTIRVIFFIGTCHIIYCTRRIVHATCRIVVHAYLKFRAKITDKNNFHCKNSNDVLGKIEYRIFFTLAKAWAARHCSCFEGCCRNVIREEERPVSSTSCLYSSCNNNCTCWTKLVAITLSIFKWICYIFFRFSLVTYWI